MVLLERNLHGHPVAGFLWERNFEEVLFKVGWEKVPTWNVCMFTKSWDYFHPVYVDDIKMVGKAPVPRKGRCLQEIVDLKDPRLHSDECTS